MRWVLELLTVALSIGWGMKWQRREDGTALLQNNVFTGANTYTSPPSSGPCGFYRVELE
jgi:hypothetical protein